MQENKTYLQVSKIRYDRSIQYKINNQIQSPEIRVIGENGENIGVISRAEALQLAKEKELDLIEISASSNPPVARIMNFDKFRYQKEKEEKKARASQKTKELKGIRITARAAENDLQTRIKKLVEFLEDGHKVEITLALRGREKGNKDWALKRLQEFLAMIPIPYTLTLPPKQGGRGFVTQLTKK